MKWIWLFASITVVLVMGVLASWLVGSALVAPVPRTVGPPPSDLPITSTTLSSESGSNLATWYIPQQDSTATIILAHSLRGDRRTMLGRARLFYSAGYSIVMSDFQAHGESPGEHLTFGFIEKLDVKATIQFVKQNHPSHRIGVVGCSLGGAAALLGSPLQIDALVLESVYPAVDEATNDRIKIFLGPLCHLVSPLLLQQFPLRLGINVNDLRPIDHIADAGCPVLIAVGERDRRTTIEESRQLFDAAQEPKELVIFPGADHVDLLNNNRDLYEERILSFLHRQLT
jgi:uncharacterized protein